MFPIAYICIVKTPGKNINASDSGISNDLGGVNTFTNPRHLFIKSN